MLAETSFVVSGASSGIGLAIARDLIAAGAMVHGLSRTPGPLEGADGYRHHAVDFVRQQELALRLKSILREIDTLDGVVVNAGQGRFGALEQFSPTQIEALIAVNLTGQLLLLRECLPRLKRRKKGDVVIIGSEAAVQGGQKGAVYSATKFALRGAAQSLRAECAASGVRVTLINPGMVQTPFFDSLSFRPAAEPDCHLTAEDIARTVLFVVSTRPGVVYDEIDLSPQKKVIDFDRKRSS